MADCLPIGDIARRSGVAATTLRYYEDLGLVRPARRENGRRCYDESVLARLTVISLCKAAQFSLDEIKLLLTDAQPGRTESRALANAKLRDLDEQMAVLRRARAIIEWGATCTCRSIEACTCTVHADFEQLTTGSDQSGCV